MSLSPQRYCKGELLVSLTRGREKEKKYERLHVLFIISLLTWPLLTQDTLFLFCGLLLACFSHSFCCSLASST